MMPRLFEARFRIDSEVAHYIDFDTNGIGVLSDAISCTVTEKYNDAYTLDMEYPIGGAYWDEITVGRMIVAKPNEIQPTQPFTVVKVSRTMGGTLKVSAEHISYRLNGILCSRICATGLAETLYAIEQHSYDNPFFLRTDFTPPPKTFDTDIPKSVRAVIGDGDNCLVKKYNFELEYDRFDVYFRKSRGVDRDVSIQYGVNLTQLSQDTSIRDFATDIYPYYRKDGVYVELDEPIQYVHYSDYATVEKAIAVDLTDYFEDGAEVTQDALMDAAKAYMDNNLAKTIPDSLKISFVELGKTTEYAGILENVPIGLCDTISVVYKKFDVARRMKVVTTVYDVLADRYQSIEIGSPRTTLADTIVDLMTSGKIISALRNLR